jgi:DNA-binding transcriptional LysR family regulator
MTLWQLTAFVTVAREGSFTKAGKVLNISQPSVSSLVIGLQKELGIKLFEKLGMKPHLTEAGRRLLQLADSTLANIAKIPEEMDQLKGLKKGKISIGCSGLAAASGLLYAVEKFKKNHQGVEVVLTVDQTWKLEKGLLEGEIDLAVVSWPPKSSLLRSELWREEKIAVVASPANPLSKKRTVSLKRLAQEPLIVSIKTFVRDMIEKEFTKRGIPFQPSISLKAYGKPRDAIKNAVIGNLGVGFLTEMHVVGDIKSGRLKVLRVPELDLRRSLYVISHKKRRNFLTEPFIEVLRNLEENSRA